MLRRYVALVLLVIFWFSPNAMFAQQAQISQVRLRSELQQSNRKRQQRIRTIPSNESRMRA